MKKWVCPLCSEIAIAATANPICKACGRAMVLLDDSLVASIPDRPGALAKFLEQLAAKNIDITALRVICKSAGTACVLFSVDRKEEALAIAGVQSADDGLFTVLSCRE